MKGRWKGNCNWRNRLSSNGAASPDINSRGGGITRAQPESLTWDRPLDRGPLESRNIQNDAILALPEQCRWKSKIGFSTKKTKTYNSWYSLVVTHPTTNQPISSLCMAERTGCPVFLSLWSYVLENTLTVVYKDLICVMLPKFLHKKLRPASRGII